MQKVVVTGGAGFIGSNLVDKLIDKGVEVLVVDDLSTGKRENINPKANFIMCNLANATIDFLCEQLKDIDTVFHLAAKTAVQESIEKPELYNNVNVVGTLKMLEVCRINKIPRFILSSTSAIYGDTKVPTSESNELKPISPYAISKLIGEEYCKLYSRIFGVDTCILRYFNVYGERMNNQGGYKLVLPIFKQLTNENKPLTINNDGEQRRDFVYVGDIADINILVSDVKDKHNSEIYNVGCGFNYSVNQIADMFGGKKSYGNNVIEPFETLADTSKTDLMFNWKPKTKLEEWVIEYK